MRKNSSIDRENNNNKNKKKKNEAKGLEFAKFLRSLESRTIYSNSERPEQFLVAECFFNLFLEVSQI